MDKIYHISKEFGESTEARKKIYSVLLQSFESGKRGLKKDVVYTSGDVCEVVFGGRDYKNNPISKEFDQSLNKWHQVVGESNLVDGVHFLKRDRSWYIIFV